MPQNMNKKVCYMCSQINATSKNLNISDTCSTSVTWLHIQQNLEGKDQLIYDKYFCRRTPVIPGLLGLLEKLCITSA